MVEAEAVVAGEEGAVRAHELLARQREQGSTEACELPSGQELGHGLDVEEPPLDRGTLENGALLGLETVDARGEQRLDRRRNGVLGGIWIVEEHGQHLLDEERVALGVLHDPAADLRGQAHAERQVVDQRLGSPSGRERPELDGRRSSTLDVSPVAPGRARHRIRRGTSRVVRVTYSRRSSSAGSAQWASSTTRTCGRDCCQRLEQAPKRPGRLLGRPTLLVRTDRAGDQPRRDVSPLHWA